MMTNNDPTIEPTKGELTLQKLKGLIEKEKDEEDGGNNPNYGPSANSAQCRNYPHYSYSRNSEAELSINEDDIPVKLEVRCDLCGTIREVPPDSFIKKRVKFYKDPVGWLAGKTVEQPDWKLPTWMRMHTIHYSI